MAEEFRSGNACGLVASTRRSVDGRSSAIEGCVRNSRSEASRFLRCRDCRPMVLYSYPRTPAASLRRRCLSIRNATIVAPGSSRLLELSTRTASPRRQRVPLHAISFGDYDGTQVECRGEERISGFWNLPKIIFVEVEREKPVVFVQYKTPPI